MSLYMLSNGWRYWLTAFVPFIVPVEADAGAVGLMIVYGAPFYRVFRIESLWLRTIVVVGLNMWCSPSGII